MGDMTYHQKIRWWPLRLTMTLVALEASFLSVLLWRLRPQEVLLPDVWPVLFAVGAFGTWVLVWRPVHRWALQVSLLGLVCGHAGRALAVLLNVHEGSVAITHTRAWVAFAIYGIVGALITFVWLIVVHPVIEIHRSRAAAEVQRQRSP